MPPERDYARLISNIKLDQDDGILRLNCGGYSLETPVGRIDFVRGGTMTMGKYLLMLALDRSAGVSELYNAIDRGDVQKVNTIVSPNWPSSEMPTMIGCWKIHR